MTLGQSTTVTTICWLFNRVDPVVQLIVMSYRIVTVPVRLFGDERLMFGASAVHEGLLPPPPPQLLVHASMSLIVTVYGGAL